MKVVSFLIVFLAYSTITVKSQKGLNNYPKMEVDSFLITIGDDSSIHYSTPPVSFDVIVVDKSNRENPPIFYNPSFLTLLPESSSKRLSNRQQFKLYMKEHAASYALTFLAGMADGMRDVCLFHFNNGDTWLNGKTSWKRKWKNGDYRQGPAFWGSTNVFVFVTDGAHCFNMISGQLNSFALATAPKGSKKFINIVRDAALYNIISLAGRVLVYNGIYDARNY